MQQPLSIQELSGGQIDVLHCLFFKGPTWDGDLPSKSARDDFVQHGIIQRWEGWNFLTPYGVIFAVSKYGDRKIAGN